MIHSVVFKEKNGNLKIYKAKRSFTNKDKIKFFKLTKPRELELSPSRYIRKEY